MGLLALVAQIAAGTDYGKSTRLPNPAEEQRFCTGCEELARLGGAAHLLIFSFDPETDSYLPAPPFPQTLPDASAWHRFLRGIDSSAAGAQLLSPYDQRTVSVCGRRLTADTVAVLLDRQGPMPEETGEYWDALRLLGSVLGSALAVRNVQASATVAIEGARQIDALASHLMSTRQKLERSLAEVRIERQRLQQANEKLSLAQQIAAMGTWEYFPSRDRVSLSPELARILLPDERHTASRADLLGLIHPDDAPRVAEAVRRALDSTEPSEVEFRLRQRDTRAESEDSLRDRYMITRIVPGLSDNGQKRLLGVCLDITQRRRSEEALRRSDALASAGRLAATIAHEINNPLAGITNLLYLVNSDPGLTADGREHLILAEKEIVRLSHIARQTLAFYRDTTAPVPVRLEDLLAEILELYAPRLKRHKVSLRSTLPLDCRIRAHRGELKQLFSNLITNSLEAMEPDCGELTITTAPNSGGVCITIGDNGPGIAPDNLASLFVPFFTTKSHTGTGLGLWVSEGIARKHGGRIEVVTSTDPATHGTAMEVHLVGVPEDPIPTL